MRALFVGRFQPLHIGHINAILEILKDNDEIIIGIGSAQESWTLKNPFTAGERFEMFLREENFKNFKERLLIVPILDINNHSIWVKYVCSLIPKFDVVYTRNPLTKILFEKEGFKVKEQEVYYFDENKKIEFSGTEIRRRIIEGKDFKGLISDSTYKFLEEINGIERLKNLKE
ncbi:MAG: nicotinamide-nucleotide adenylyltransferase [Candidatus Altarchaeaceae archaeon]